MDRLTLEQLMERFREPLGLTLVTDAAVSGSDITWSEISRPGLLLAGFEDGFSPDRIQVLAESEFAYLESLDSAAQDAALGRLFVSTVPCVIVSGGRKAPAELVERGNRTGVPVFESDLPAGRLARELSTVLDDLLAPEATIHGTLVDVYGVGLLFTGKSGIGKSECGLDLVEHGHRLVADDVVHVTSTSQGHLIGSGNDLLRHYMEIRGVGIIDVQAIFGIRAIRKQKRIEVEVRLVSWSELDDYERLGVDEVHTEILGVKIPLVTLPLVTGKNITVVSEVIAMNHLLKLRGVHPAREFDRRLRDLASTEERARRMLPGDNE